MRLEEYGYILSCWSRHYLMQVGMQIGVGYKQVQIYWCHLIYLTLIRAASIIQ